MFCANCNEETNNKKFCSQSCSAKYTNLHRPKSSYRQPEGKCKDCSTPISTSRTYCKSCKPKYIRGDITLKEAIYQELHKSSAFALVRSRARGVGKELKLTKCQKCNYSRHIEICHIKPICEFDENTLLSVINHPSNLLALCPNCHWEHDHPHL